MLNDIRGSVFFWTVPTVDDAPTLSRTTLRIWMLRLMPLKGYGSLWVLSRSSHPAKRNHRLPAATMEPYSVRLDLHGAELPDDAAEVLNGNAGDQSPVQ